MIFSDCKSKAFLHSNGMIFVGKDGQAINVSKLGLESGKMIPASKYGQSDESSNLGELSEEEKALIEEIRVIWRSILNTDIEDSSNFFKLGAGSMDVTRLVESVIELDQCAQINLLNEHVYMNSQFDEFVSMVIRKLRHGDDDDKPKLNFTPIEMNVNKRTIRFPNQLFINNEFVNSSDPSQTLKAIDPSDESIICEVQCATKEDVDRAVLCAQAAFEDGEWANMNARDRGRLLYRLADLMEQHKEELATLESIDSGAVYTLAVKTHIGMSIDTWRYFAGWCDKIHGETIPINNARPNRNLTFTRKEPIGVCGIITPWNYPLMMVSWKTAACLAAGNTVVIKPAEVTPLTALKFAELTVYAGFPPGVINILPGTGTGAGRAMTQHPLIRKLGFTGSTPVGKEILASCANSNLKKCSLELGGKSPLIIFKDCDLDRAVRFALSAVFFNKGLSFVVNI